LFFTGFAVGFHIDALYTFAFRLLTQFTLLPSVPYVGRVSCKGGGLECNVRILLCAMARSSGCCGHDICTCDRRANNVMSGLTVRSAINS